MATPSAQFFLTLRVELPRESGTITKVSGAITDAGGAIVAVDTVKAHGDYFDCDRFNRFWPPTHGASRPTSSVTAPAP